MAFNQTITEDMLEWFLGIGTPTPSSARHISFHTADPGTTGANETSALSRTQHDSWKTGTAGDGTVANNGGGESAAATAGATLTHFGVWSAATGGVFYFGGALAASKTIAASDTVSWADGALTASIT